MSEVCPANVSLDADGQSRTACSWGGGTNDTQTNYGVVIGGEWSLAINNCGKWLNGVDSVPSYESSGLGNCTRFEEWFNWDDDMRAGLSMYCQSSMDALQNWFFWTWKIGNSTELGYAPSPFWHYQLGLKEGWIPKDPRTAGGYCERVMNVGGNQVSVSSRPFHPLDPKTDYATSSPVLSLLRPLAVFPPQPSPWHRSPRTASGHLHR